MWCYTLSFTAAPRLVWRSSGLKTEGKPLSMSLEISLVSQHMLMSGRPGIETVDQKWSESLCVEQVSLNINQQVVVV